MTISNALTAAVSIIRYYKHFADPGGLTSSENTVFSEFVSAILRDWRIHWIDSWTECIKYFKIQ